jgi:hypothetical protein
MHIDDEQSMTLLCRQKKRRVFLCMCIIIIHRWRKREKKGRKKRRAGEKKGKSRSRTKRWESALKQTYNRSQLIATKCLFFDKKKREGKKTRYLSFSRQTSSSKLQVSPLSWLWKWTNLHRRWRLRQVFFSLTFNISLNICAH